MFVFESAARINLHERVLLPATARFPPPEGSVRDWPPAEAEAKWQAAIAEYKSAYGGMFTPEHLAAQRELKAGTDDSFCAEPSTALCELWSDYRANQWAKDDEANRAFIQHLQAIRPELWEAIARDHVELYRSPWPDRPLLVHVAVEVGGPGAAYTTEANYVTLGSADDRHRGEQGLEILFHEASHLMFNSFDAALTEAQTKTGIEPPPGLWHALIFATTGHILRKHLGDGYVPYVEAQGLFTRGPWKAYPALFAEHWQPYLEGKAQLEDALTDLLKASASN